MYGQLLYRGIPHQRGCAGKLQQVNVLTAAGLKADPVMARQMGIPSRVAVGFLPGHQTSPDTHVVSAHDSHAWPELYFAGVGWVPFEPTPAADIPAQRSYPEDPRATPEPSSQ